MAIQTFPKGATVKFTGWVGEADPNITVTEGDEFIITEILPADGDVPSYGLQSKINPNQFTSMYHDEVSLVSAAAVADLTPEADNAFDTAFAEGEVEASEAFQTGEMDEHFADGNMDSVIEGEVVQQPEPTPEPVQAPVAETKVKAKGKVKAKEEPTPEPKTEMQVQHTNFTLSTPEVATTEGEVVHGGDFIPERDITAYVARIIASEGDLAAAERINRAAVANDFVLGGLIAHIHAEKSYTQMGFEADDKDKGFGEYVESKLGIKYRKAMFLMNNYNFFSQFGDDVINKVIQMGWPKAKEIEQASRRAGFNMGDVPALVEFAEDKTRSDLVDHINTEYVKVEAGETESRKKTMFKFALFSDEGDVVANLLNSMVESGQAPDVNQALLMVATAYIDFNDVAIDVKEEVAIATLEKRTGKKVTLTEK